MRAPFVQACAPTEDELHSLLHTVITRLMKMLTRRGVLIEEMGQTCLPVTMLNEGTVGHGVG